PDADPYLAGEARLWLGAAQSGAGELQQGATTIKAAIDVIQQRMGPAFVSVARGTERLAETESKQGRHEEAKRLIEQALATYREIGGPEYILTITGLSAEASGAARAGDLPRALALGRE